MSDIVIGYDGSESSKAALEEGLELAKKLRDRVVIVFGFAPGGYGGGEVPAQRKAVKEFGQKVTDEAMKRAKRRRVRAEVEMVNADSDVALIRVAKKRKTRMIVVGSHGEHPLKGALLGTTPYRLVGLSKIPVLVVRP